MSRQGKIEYIITVGIFVASLTIVESVALHHGIDGIVLKAYFFLLGTPIGYLIRKWKE